MFIGRERELEILNNLYKQNKFQLFILYGRRRVGKTTLITEFCRDKDSIFFAAEQDSDKGNLQKFSEMVFLHYNEKTLSDFSSWENAIEFIHSRQVEKPLVLVFDEFPYLAKTNKKLLSNLQHLIDHKLKDGKLFIIICGSYINFMEKEILGQTSPVFGRRTAQLKLQPFTYDAACLFLRGLTKEEKLNFYGATGGTAQYLSRYRSDISYKENIKELFLSPAGYLFEEPKLLLKQEIQEPGIYNSVIEAIATGHTKANEIATKTGEESAKCLKYIQTLCNLGILYKEIPFGEKETSRKTIYGIFDLMFRFWYKYVFTNLSLLEAGAAEVIYERKIKPDYTNYMGLVFERICKEYLTKENVSGNLPILFTSMGRWWGTDSKNKKEVEIDIVAKDGKDYIFGECKWQNERADVTVLNTLKEKANVFNNNRERTWYFIFSKSGFTSGLKKQAEKDNDVILIGLNEILK